MTLTHNHHCEGNSEENLPELSPLEELEQSVLTAFSNYSNRRVKRYYELGYDIESESRDGKDFSYERYGGLGLHLRLPAVLSPIESMDLNEYTALKCRIRKGKAGYYASLMVDDASAVHPLYPDDDVPFWFQSPDRKLDPFLEYCAKKHICCELIAHLAPSLKRIEIRDIIMSGSDRRGLSSLGNSFAEEDLFQPVKRKVIAKLNGLDVDLFDMRYESKAECSMVMEFFPEYYPDDVAAYVKKALDDQTKMFMNSSEKRQLLSNALGLINVDWRIHHMSYPSLPEIRDKLDREFYGMESVKNRVLEVMARLRKCGSTPKWGILLHGLPGVGKTSFVKFFTELLQCPSFYLDLNSATDAEGITGTSKIYDNGQPGDIMQAIISSRAAQQTVVINELDKMGTDKQSVLLGLLDRQGFTDVNIGYPIVLNGLTFIATCNDLNALSDPIRDRFEIIELPPYSVKEKQAIFNGYVFPRQLQNAGLSADDIRIEEKAVEVLCKDYVEDQGARDLEKYGDRIIDNFLRLKDSGQPVPECYTAEMIPELLGPPKRNTVRMDLTPGMVRTVTVVNGKVIPNIVEASVVPGKGEIRIIGVPDPVAQDHIKVACHYITSLGLFPKDERDILIRLQNPCFTAFRNVLGFAALCAILSDLSGYLFDADALVAGGVTLHGGLYYDGDSFDTILSYCEDNDISKIFCPVGSTDKIRNIHKDIALLETPDVPSFLALAGISF